MEPKCLIYLEIKIFNFRKLKIHPFFLISEIENSSLFFSRDTVQVRMGPVAAEVEDAPEIRSNEIVNGMNSGSR